MGKVAFRGLGLMGTPTAARLFNAGHDLSVWTGPAWGRRRWSSLAPRRRLPRPKPSRESTRSLPCWRPRRLSEQGAVRGGRCDGLSPGQMLVDMSTVGPEVISSVAARLPSRVTLVDAPCGATFPEATTGRLAIYVGATRGDYEQVQSLLSPLGTAPRGRVRAGGSRPGPRAVDVSSMGSRHRSATIGRKGRFPKVPAEVVMGVGISWHRP